MCGIQVVSPPTCSARLYSSGATSATLWNLGWLCTGGERGAGQRRALAHQTGLRLRLRLRLLRL